MKNEESKIYLRNEEIKMPNGIFREPSRIESNKINKLRRRQRRQEIQLFQTLQELNKFERKYPFYRG